MGEKGRIKPLQRDIYYDNGSSAREIVEGTIPRGHMIEDTPYFTGVDGEGKDTKEIPMKVTKALILDGQKKLNTFCSVCHGYAGYGNGTIVKRGFTTPPTFHSDRLRNIAAGHFFGVMSQGFGDMGSYSDVLSEYDRWAVTAYIRALQRSQNAKLDDAPPKVRERLQNLSGGELSE